MTSALLALALLAALAGPAALRLYHHPGFITGRDGRLSTSTTLALAWTVILVWLLLTCLAYGLTAGGGVAWFQGEHGPLSNLTTVYLPLLGGPYLALIGAKTVVGIRVQNGSLAKPAARPTTTGRRPLRELIANDSGRTDLVDLQYVALGAVTMLYVVLFFLADVGGGLPRLPGEIWALTGAPAGAYLVNKLATRANPVITRVTLADGILTIEGGGFDDARVTVADTPVPAVLDPVTCALTTPLPNPPPAPFPVTVTSHGLRSDPYLYAPAADAPPGPAKTSPATPANPTTPPAPTAPSSPAAPTSPATPSSPAGV
ncbi:MULTISPECIES: hypothetical protein [unclassified Streptomyces]|uniref:hypothetical protein n=1 Tax=unclassified Streptomyces TaxID=2593676 RepID=UPI002E37DB1E|nr:MULTISPECIES: hypothetical protein [unclassified Streptomyces]WUC66121.1 hypothetical protein OG861_18820 [Streptomyces sp. NBC_00539]